MNSLYLLALIVAIVVGGETRCPAKCKCFPESFVNCSRLELSDFPSQMPDDLQKLELSHNKISKLTSSIFENLTDLQSLDLSYNNITTFKRNVFAEISLTHLNLNHNNLRFNSRQLERRRGLFRDDIVYSLQNFSASHNNLSGVIHENFVYQLEELVHLDLSYNKFIFIDNHVFPTTLKYLDLSHNPIVGINDSPFQFLFELVYLSLDGLHLNTLRSGLFEDLEGLEHLILGGEFLTSLPEDLLQGLFSLKKLQIVGTKITSLPEALMSFIVELTDLDLSNNALTSLPMEFFDYLPLLTTLNLKGNNIASLNHFRSDFAWQSLKNLNLASNRFQIVPKALSEISSLEMLNLAHNNLSMINRSLSSRSLQVLNITGCNITSLNSSVFKNLTALKMVDLSKNNFTSLPTFVVSGSVELIINGNPWNCDCRFFTSLYKRPNHTQTESIRYRCDDNSLKCLICHTPTNLNNMYITDLNETFQSCLYSETIAQQFNLNIIIVIAVVIILFVVLVIIGIVISMKKNNCQKSKTIQHHSIDSTIYPYAVTYDKGETIIATKKGNSKIKSSSTINHTTPCMISRASNPVYSSICEVVPIKDSSEKTIYSCADDVSTTTDNISCRSFPSLATDESDYLRPINSKGSTLPHDYENIPKNNEPSEEVENSPYVVMMCG